ncbi:MAG: beta-lactamase family protein [Candidatus Aminicenantes bacterium]|nr:beta-lactamase family protein [Candidatus Aminicenantes bacterium]
MFRIRRISGQVLPTDGGRRTSFSIASILLVVFAAAGHWNCPGSEGGSAAAIKDYIETAHRAWNFQGAVLVSRAGKVIFSGGFGFADAAGLRTNSPQTVFSIGSVTKTFTAAAILQLSDAGLVDLDAPVAEYLPEYDLAGRSGVTLRRLLSHSSGVPDVGLDPRALGDLTKARAPLDLLELVKDKPLDFAPGEASRYSNAGYVLLGLVIERVSGMSYADYVHEHLLCPLQMTATSYGADASSETRIARGLIEGPDGRLREAPLFHPSLGYSAGGLFSTVEDMWRWDRGLEGEDILSAAARAQMFMPQRDDFGLGWLIMETWGRKDIAHGGGAPGYDAWVERWPHERVFVAVLSNTGGSPVGEIGRSLAAILFGQDVQPPEARRATVADGASLGEYAGFYKINEESRREILGEGNTLFVRRDGGPRYPVLPCGQDLFFFPNDKGASIRFFRDREGRVSGHVLHRLGLDEIAMKVEGAGSR